MSKVVDEILNKLEAASAGLTVLDLCGDGLKQQQVKTALTNMNNRGVVSYNASTQRYFLTTKGETPVKNKPYERSSKGMCHMLFDSLDDLISGKISNKDATTRVSIANGVAKQKMVEIAVGRAGGNTASVRYD